MLATTWDGHLRLDLVAGDALLLTLITAEPTTTAALRAGLDAAFVTADPDGPPARVRTVLDGNRLPTDIAELLGPRIAAAVTALTDTGAWLRLDLAEVDDLAESWAPYRVRVLAGTPERPVAGSWSEGLWTALDIDWSRLLGPRAPALVPRSDAALDPAEQDDTTGASDITGTTGAWPIPVAIARACGCAPSLGWRARAAPGGGVELELSAEPGPADADRAELLAGPDSPGAQWVPLLAGADGVLRARLTVPGADVPALRLRARIGGRS